MKHVLSRLLLAAALILSQWPVMTFAVIFTNSPSAISNNYTGTITLQITGLTNTETVVVQKFLDLNTNGLVDPSDYLVQQFKLTDGQASLFTNGTTVVTNMNVPGDLDGAANGQITAILNFQNGDFIQNTVGEYLYVLSSPVGHFSPITIPFAVTNFPYGQSISGNVVSNNVNSVTVSNAVVLLFPPPSSNGDLGNPVAQTVANDSGAYSIAMPQGSYLMFAVRSNYVANLSSPTVVTLGSSGVTTNLSLYKASSTISGKYVDASSSSTTLPGIFSPVDGNGYIAVAFTDTNGNFTERVTNGTYNVGSDNRGLVIHGYVGYENTPTNANAGTTGITLKFPKATALIYGNVVDSFGNPLQGIDISVSDMNSNLYQMDYYSISNGNYWAGVLANNESWQLQVGNGYNSLASNYVFSTASAPQNGGVTFTNGQAFQANITAILATYQITGYLQDNFGNPLPDISMAASATINGTNYFPLEVETDTNGYYAFNVPSGTWTISVSDSCDGDNGNNLSTNYQCPNSQTVTISTTNGMADFIVQTNINSGGSLEITTTSLSNGVAGTYYDQQLNADGGNPPNPGDYYWQLSSGSLPNGLSLQSGGFITGTPTGPGTSYFVVQVSDQNGNNSTAGFDLTINSGTLQVTTTSLPFGVTNVPYSQQLAASGGQPFSSGYYSWSINSGQLPPGLGLATNGIISGTPTVLGTSNFTVRVTDSLSATATQSLALAIMPLLTGVGFSVTPSAVSNSYEGTLMLSVTGLTAGESVTVQKYLDANTNGVIDGNDLLVQQFNLTDGQASLFTNGATVVTNMNIPGDMNPAAGAITAQLAFNNNFSGQNVVGKYLYKLTSPSGHFAPMTNSFSVTNFPFGQSFSGLVVSNATSVPLTNAIVLLGQPSGDGGQNIEYGTVANDSGNYTISVPPGNYLLVGIKSNYLANAGAPTLTLTNGTTFVTNVSLLLATQTISGVYNNINNTNIALPGILNAMESTNNLLGVVFTSSNGTFNTWVTASKWKIDSDDEGYDLLGYLELQNKTNINTGSGSVSGVTISVPQLTALFYGRVQDTFGNPLEGVDIYASDNNNLYQSDAYTDTNGDFFSGALAGETWQIQVDGDQELANADYVYSQSQVNQDGGVTLSPGQAMQVNFTALLATNYITGHVEDNFGNPIVEVGVYATATINSVSYGQGTVDTDTNGNYSMNVANGTWTVSINDSCQGGGNDQLSSNYQCPNPQTVTVYNTNGVANFIVQTNVSSGSLQVTTLSLSNGVVGTYYDQQLNADGGNPPNPGDYVWSLYSGSLPNGLTLQSGGFITGTPTTNGTSSFTVQVSDQDGNTATRGLSLTISSGSSKPVLSLAKYLGNGRFQLQLNGMAGQNYTLQMATNLVSATWNTVLITNNSTTNSFLVTDPNATNSARYYRILLGP